MALTDEQLAALGLAMPPPDPTMAPPAALPAAILPSSAAPKYPSSILGDKIAPGAPITHQDLTALPHEQGKEIFQQEMPKITSAPGTTDYFRQRQEQLDFKAQHPWGDPISAHPGVLGKILHGLSVAGNIAGDIVAPGTMANIPGTQLHNEIERAGNEHGILASENEQNQATEAQAKKTEADAKKEVADQGGKPTKPEPIFDKAGNVIGFNTGTDLLSLTSPGLTPEMKAIASAAKPAKPDQPFQTDKVVRIVNGVPHEVLIDKQTGEDVKDLGQTKIPGESADTKRNASEMAQVEREARQNIRKASDQYRATQQSVSQLQASIDAAKDGNGLLTSFVPTMEVLGINASNGVHRISPAEAQAAQLPGGWVERFNAWFDKASTGKLSPQLQEEGKALAKVLSDSAYQRYQSTYHDESGIVSGYGGTDFEKRVPLIQHEGQGGGGGNQSGRSVSFAAAKGLTQNKGKSDEEIRKDIEAHGYKVTD